MEVGEIIHPFWIQMIIPLLILVNAAWIGPVLRNFLERIRRRWKTNIGLNALLYALALPIQWTIWGLALLYSLDIIANSLEVDVDCFYLSQTRRVFLLAMATWTAFRYKHVLESELTARYESESKEKFALVTAMSRLLSAFVIIIAALILLEILHIPIAALLAFGGLGGLAIGLAAQGLIANFFGGLMIHINRHIAIGDWILSPNKQFEGVVEEIGWYQTRIRTLERRPTFIPNSLITDAIIENPGRMRHRRILNSFFLTYQSLDKVEGIVKEIEEMMKGQKGVDKNQLCFVNFTDYAESGIEFEFYCFSTQTRVREYRQVREQILLKIAKIVKEAGAEFAYPTRTLYMANEKSD